MFFWNTQSNERVFFFQSRELAETPEGNTASDPPCLNRTKTDAGNQKGSFPLRNEPFCYISTLAAASG